MIFARCDICGKQIDKDIFNVDRISAPEGHFDVCPQCAEWVGKLDLVTLYLTALQTEWTLAHPPEPEDPVSEVPPDPDPAPEAQETASGIKGRYAPLKRAVLEALEEYRKTYGPGVKGLAARAGVKEAEVELVRMRRKVPLAVWTGLAEALGVEHKEV